MSSEKIGVKGRFRIRLGSEDENGNVRIEGDSGWQENQILNLGFQNYICALIGGVEGSVQVGSIAIGVNSDAPASDATTIADQTVRTAVGNATVGSTTMRATATIASDNCPGACNINNAGLVNATASDGTFLCGNTFASSAWATNQGLSATYDLVFAEA